MNRVRNLQGPALVLSLLSLLWIIVILGLLALKPSALSVGTITTILQFSTILALVSLGQGMVILAGGAGIDLSVGGTVSLSAVLGMLVLKAGLSPFFLPFVCIGTGTALGAFNGVLVMKLRILPLIATLGTFFVYSGVALSLTGGSAQSGVPDWLLWWGRGVLAGIPVPFLTIAVPAFALAGIVLAWTSWGRWVYAMGFNERSARLVGVPVDRARLILYSLSGTLAGAAALFSLAWLGSGRPNIGQNLELESLTAAMLGGIAIFGGRGGVGGVFAAVMLLVTLKTGLLQLNVNTVWQVGIVGALLIFVLLADRFSQSWR
ncbi:ABC transporter permease [Phyllobacterium bourgognense]|uniref:Autoinducer 2 import system permease protein LsrC n=1 Tax=Phyllobacterium bourgognense TaxID=314236 RepID=A0A368YFJ6_9HYPH|nr:ABC transporter permease [Phyllobacterium bourgognense]RCW79010.1 ribose transport system permease protein [Phyllobacterium bourgognense]